MASRAFDDIIDLEEQFYDDGYQQGYSDGIKAGQIEGRTFGLEKGFEKFVESGKLYGRSVIWANRIPQAQDNDTSVEANSAQDLSMKLPQLPKNSRLAKHIRTLHALSESESLSTENTEEAVSEFEDRSRRAQAKVKVIERLVGEIQRSSASQGDGSSNGSVEG